MHREKGKHGLKQEVKEQFAPLDALMPMIREQLAAGKNVRFSPRGISMLPMLRQGIDSVELSAVPERLRRFDLPLYQRDNGKYILHRVIAVGESYTCMGDNQFQPEPGVEHRQMIGLVTAFYRRDRRISVNAPGYRVYCRLWYVSRPLRHFVHRGIGFIRRHCT